MKYIIYICMSAALSYLLSYCVLLYSGRFKIDKKVYDERVRLHSKRIPRLGGIVVYLGLWAIIFFIFLSSKYGSFDIKKLIGIFASSLPVAFIGFYDDLVKRVSYKVKFIFQMLSALVLVAVGYNIGAISIPFASNLSVGIFGPYLVVLWILVIMNAVNLIDGLDGLAAGICLIASIGFFIIGHNAGNILVLSVVSALIGVILGFIKYNFYPARLFLGDSGSLFLGLMIGVVAMELSIKRATVVLMAVPLLLIFIPVAGILFTFIRRIGEGKNPFKPDTMHLHYRLMRAGLSHKNVVIVFYVVAILYVFLGILCYFLPPYYEFLVLAAALGIMLFLYAAALIFIYRKRGTH